MENWAADTSAVVGSRRALRSFLQATMRMFEAYFGTGGGWANAGARNKSPGGFSTADVVAGLSAEDRRQLDAAVSFEADLYDVALQAHEATCRALLGSDEPACRARGEIVGDERMCRARERL